MHYVRVHTFLSGAEQMSWIYLFSRGAIPLMCISCKRGGCAARYTKDKKYPSLCTCLRSHKLYLTQILCPSPLSIFHTMWRILSQINLCGWSYEKYFASYYGRKYTICPHFYRRTKYFLPIWCCFLLWTLRHGIFRTIFFCSCMALKILYRMEAILFKFYFLICVDAF